jgi:hypothetical protein
VCPPPGSGATAQPATAGEEGGAAQAAGAATAEGGEGANTGGATTDGRRRRRSTLATAERRTRRHGAAATTEKSGDGLGRRWGGAAVSAWCGRSSSPGRRQAGAGSRFRWGGSLRSSVVRLEVGLGSRVGRLLTGVEDENIRVSSIYTWDAKLLSGHLSGRRKSGRASGRHYGPKWRPRHYRPIVPGQH